MDLIRIYSEIAFAKVAERYLSNRIVSDDISENPSFPLTEDAFVDEERIHHPELPDETLKLIYRLGIDDWSKYGFKDKCGDESNIFQILAFLSDQMLEEKHSQPIVHFKDLFRWREVTQLLGEDLLTCAFLAFRDRIDNSKSRDFTWPSTIHNDNPSLNYLFKTKGLCELHSHLKASTNTFEISWVSLMNHIGKLHKQFEYLAVDHEPSKKGDLDVSLYDYIKEAAFIRIEIHRHITYSDKSFSVANLSPTPEADEIDRKTATLRDMHSSGWTPDYICACPDSPMSVYAGERQFLYSTLKRIFNGNDPDLTVALYRYILAKSLLRSYLVQTNKNIGFSNFQRFQNLKAKFLAKDYYFLLDSLPLWEAKTHNFTTIFETRITPVESKKKLLSQVVRLNKWTLTKDVLDEWDKKEYLTNRDWFLIFHFIKLGEKGAVRHIRDYDAREKYKKESLILKEINEICHNAAADAASSEYACRPEVFGQAFRFLRHHGFDATFHAGEDFYDLADGLRAIDETIHFLELHTSDRIGHALALGADARKYYTDRHYYTALPLQWMLDNAVWLLMKSKEYGISIDTKTEWFLKNTYNQLAYEIGYSKSNDTDEFQQHIPAIPDIIDYWDSMALRGDNPERYTTNGFNGNMVNLSSDIWDFYSLLKSERVGFIRKYNSVATIIYYQYHFDNIIKANGRKVRAFKIPEGYANLITDLQNAMIKDIAKRQLCIECCPSSNVRIGRLDRFDTHPIFRFMPLDPNATRYPLYVTVNTDDLGVFSTSLPNEYSLLALALMKMKNSDGSHRYSSQDVYDWIERLIENSHKFTFLKSSTPVNDKSGT